MTPEQQTELLIKCDTDLSPLGFGGFSIPDIIGPVRTPDLVLSRSYIIMYFRFVHGFTFQKIGSLINRHHATVLHMIEEKGSKRFSGKLREFYSKIEPLIKARQQQIDDLAQQRKADIESASELLRVAKHQSNPLANHRTY